MTVSLRTRSIDETNAEHIRRTLTLYRVSVSQKHCRLLQTTITQRDKNL
jgi:hypothetical protein